LIRVYSNSPSGDFFLLEWSIKFIFVEDVLPKLLHL